MKHLLPGGEAPRFTSPVPPRLPHFATRQSVHHLATMVAGAYAPRRPPNAWPPGLPAPPGPCYWLVASGTPTGWRGGCLVAGLVRSTVCHYSLGGCSALVVCAWRLRRVPGAGAGSRVSPLANTTFPRTPRNACGGSSRPGVLSARLPIRHSMRSVRSAGSVRSPFRSAPRGRCVCVRLCLSCFRAPPPRVGVPLQAWFRGRASVGPFQVVRASPRFLPRPVLHPVSSGGGSGLVPSSPCLPLGCALVGGPVRPGRSGRLGGVGGGGQGGRSVCCPPWALGWVRGRLGGLRGWGAGGRFASVRCAAFLVRASRRASLASLSPGRVWSTYCSGLCPCAPVRARFERGAVGRPCVPAGRLLAGWQAGWRRGLPRSLWDQAGDGLGARGAWTKWRSAGAAAFSGGRGGRSTGLGGGYRAEVPEPITSIPRPGWGGRGGGSCRGDAVPLLTFAPPVHFFGGFGWWLEGPGRGPFAVGFRCVSGGGSVSPGPRGTGAPACVGGHCFGGGALPRAL